MWLAPGATQGYLVAAESVRYEPCNTAYGGDADAGQVVNPAVGQVLLQQLDDVPAVDECLKLSWRAQVLEEPAAFIDRVQAANRLEKCILGGFLVPGAVVTVGLHNCSSVLTR